MAFRPPRVEKEILKPAEKAGAKPFDCLRHDRHRFSGGLQLARRNHQLAGDLSLRAQ